MLHSHVNSENLRNTVTHTSQTPPMWLFKILNSVLGTYNTMKKVHFQFYKDITQIKYVTKINISGKYRTIRIIHNLTQKFKEEFQDKFKFFSFSFYLWSTKTITGRSVLCQFVLITLFVLISFSRIIVGRVGYTRSMGSKRSPKFVISLRFFCENPPFGCSGGGDHRYRVRVFGTGLKKCIRKTKRVTCRGLVTSKIRVTEEWSV